MVSFLVGEVRFSIFKRYNIMNENMNKDKMMIKKLILNFEEFGSRRGWVSGRAQTRTKQNQERNTSILKMACFQRTLFPSNEVWFSVKNLTTRQIYIINTNEEANPYNPLPLIIQRILHKKLFSSYRNIFVRFSL